MEALTCYFAINSENSSSTGQNGYDFIIRGTPMVVLDGIMHINSENRRGLSTEPLRITACNE
jgi:hypothetical protein